MRIPSRGGISGGRDRSPANERFKARYGALFWGSVAAAAVVHAIAYWLWPALDVPEWLARVEMMALVPPIEAAPAPEPPPYIVPPPPGFTVDPRFDEIPRPAEPLPGKVPDLPADALFRELMHGPRFTPYEIAPVLQNRSTVVDAMLRLYPYGSPGVPDRIRAVLWFLIDERGIVRQTLIKESSGHAVVDDAVRKVADLMEFTPAWSGDRSVPVWITLPVVFRIQADVAGIADTSVVGGAGPVPWLTRAARGRGPGGR